MTTNRIDEAKARVDFIWLFQQEAPDHYREHGNSFNPWGDGSDPSFFLDSDHGYGFNDHTKRDHLDLLEWSRGCITSEATELLCEMAGLEPGGNGDSEKRKTNRSERRRPERVAPPPQTTQKPRTSFASFEDACNHYKPEAVFRYDHASGSLNYAELKIKTERGKVCLPLHEEADGHWYLDLRNVTRTLFDLPELLASGPDEPVFFCEGAKDVQTAQRLGFVATTSGSSGSLKRAVADGALEPLRGRTVFMFPDHDDAGRKMAEVAREILPGIVRELKICWVPNSEQTEGFDLSDYVATVGEEHAARLLVELIDDTESEAKSQEAEKEEIGPAEPEDVPAGTEGEPEPRKGIDLAHLPFDGDEYTSLPPAPTDDPNSAPTENTQTPMSSTGVPLVENGTYQCKIVGARLHETRAGNWRLACKLERLDAPHAKHLWWSLVISQKGVRYVKRDMLKLGYTGTLQSLQTDTSFFLGKTIEVSLKNEMRPDDSWWTTTSLIRLVPEDEASSVSIKTDTGRKPLTFPKPVTFYDLMQMELPEPQMTVPGLIPPGLGILAGAPKIGKSWQASQLSLAVATGGFFLGDFRAVRGDVLHLALEDNFRRFHSRLFKQLNGATAPRNAEFIDTWPAISSNEAKNPGGLTGIHKWLEDHHETAKLVIIDTLAKVKPRRGKGDDAYASDYSALEGLQRLAAQYAVTILVLHHLNKGTQHSDEFNQVNGTSAITGCADFVMMLTRPRGSNDGKLFVSGRDIEETRGIVTFDPDTGTWRWTGEEAELRMSSERNELLTILRNHGAPMSAKEVAELTDPKKSAGAVQRNLSRMVDAGLIDRAVAQPGKYVAAPGKEDFCDASYLL